MNYIPLKVHTRLILDDALFRDCILSPFTEFLGSIGEILNFQ